MDEASRQRLQKESLFSLEVVVEKILLANPKIQCRFPSIAFKLLDFPTLMIYHVDPEVAENIKRKMKMDTKFKLPSQLYELQDRFGNFITRKGKSCLFTVSISNLLAYLYETPLYVMLVDTYPETPKLLGSCTIPMNSTMEKVHSDVRTLGLSVPVTHGEKGTFTVYNLMGVEVGNVTLGYRILSLGTGLMSHIPEKNVMKVTPPSHFPKEIASPQIPINVIEDQICNAETVVNTFTSVKDIENFDKDVQVKFESPRPENMGMCTQTEMDIRDFNDSATQTGKRKKGLQTKENVWTKTQSDEEHFVDVFVSNAVCPPPLFYNSEKQPTVQHGLQFMDYLSKVKDGASSENSDMYDSDDTIREEDRFSESEYDVITESKAEIKQVRTKQKIKSKQKKIVSEAQHIPNLNNFPLLNALIAEIGALQGNQNVKAGPNIMISNPKSQQYVKKPPISAREREQALKRLATPRQVTLHEKQALIAQQARESFKDLSARPVSQPASPSRAHIDHMPIHKPVPKNKSWVSSKPQKPVKQTTLRYGMTHTQRVRLAKTNPKLLAKLEQEEKERLEIRKREKLAQEFGTSSVNVSTEISKYPDKHGAHKKPVPTPRQSATNVYEKEPPPITPRGSRTRVRDLDSEDYDDLDTIPQKGPSEQDSIDSYASNLDIHIPTASIDDNQSDNSLFEESLNENKDARKNVQNPGFAMASVESIDIPSNEHAKGFQSTEPQEGEVPELRMVVDKYSDEDDSGGEEPQLRKVIDKYSDDDDRSQSHESYISARSEISDLLPDTSDALNDKLKPDLHTIPNPPSSIKSPVQGHPQGKSSGLQSSIRRPFGASSTLDDTALNNSEFLTESQIPTQHSVESFDSFDTSDISTARKRRSKFAGKKPGRSLEKIPSVKTESVSSYNPTDPDALSEGDDYSDEFEDYSLSQTEEVKQMSDAKVVPEARFGYTWSGTT